MDKISLATSKLNLQPDILKSREEYLAENFFPEIIPEMFMIILKDLFQSTKRILPDLLALFHDEANNISQDREPQLLENTQLDVISSGLLLIIFFGLLFLEILVINAIGWSLPVHILLISNIQSMSVRLNVAIHNKWLLLQPLGTDRKEIQSLR